MAAAAAAALDQPCNMQVSEVQQTAAAADCVANNINTVHAGDSKLESKCGGRTDTFLRRKRGRFLTQSWFRTTSYRTHCKDGQH